tara:strand:+ start:389 stop:1567 length:1179 start_codon:yes stop_codon:yes gene_type:complete
MPSVGLTFPGSGIASRPACDAPSCEDCYGFLVENVVATEKRVTKTRPELVGLCRYPIPQTGRYERLRLDKNENVSGVPPGAISEMLAGISPHFLSAYPEPGPLYEKIAGWHGLKVENVLITSGSEMAIRYLFEAYLDRGDEILFLNPSFAMFEVYAALCGARIVTVDFKQDMTVDPAEILDGLSSRTKIVAIANPNNPTGTVILEADLCRVVERASRFDALVLVDEAYYHFYGSTMLTKLSSYENLVITRSFSKACGLASVRLGYALSNPYVISEVKKLQPIDHANAFALKLGEYIVDHEELIWDYVAQVEDGRSYLTTEIERMGFVYSHSYGNFLLMDMKDKREGFIAEAKRRGILIGTQVRLPFPNNYVRATVGPLEEMRQLVAALQAVV